MMGVCCDKPYRHRQVGVARTLASGSKSAQTIHHIFLDFSEGFLQTLYVFGKTGFITRKNCFQILQPFEIVAGNIIYGNNSRIYFWHWRKYCLETLLMYFWGAVCFYGQRQQTFFTVFGYCSARQLLLH